jgi:hypothetical protein
MTDRRRFLGYLVAAPTLAAAAEFGLSAQRPAEAAIPSGPQPPEIYDLNDMLRDAALPTSNLITVTINRDGTASFALPRAEVGQGITTSTAMLVAEELDLPVRRVIVPMRDPSCSSTSSPAARTRPSRPSHQFESLLRSPSRPSYRPRRSSSVTPWTD